jgi:hypothetical protein
VSADKIIALVFGVLILAWPAIFSWVKQGLEALPHPAPSVPLPTPSVPAAAPKTSYIAAIENLGIVRTRLVQTECLGEQQKAAIDTLTLALVGGSEK